MDDAVVNSPGAPDDLRASVPRFLVELTAWVSVPWALWGWSVVAALAAVVALIAVPSTFGMPGAKKQRVPVAVGARTAIAIELIQPVAAVIGAGFAWSSVTAVIVAVLAGVACVAQRQRWRWMLAQ